VAGSTMKDSAYDLLCAVLLGVGNMCMFLGYDTQTTIVEPVLHSVHDRSPDIINQHAGYHGVATLLFTFTFSSFLAPWTLGMLGSKWSILLGSMLFSFHLGSFLYIHYVPYYLTSALLGMGYSLFYSGHGAYITEHSTKRTIERNSALSWSLATSSLVLGGFVLILTAQPPAEVDTLVYSTNETKVGNEAKSYRQYSDYEIRLMYGAFAAVSIVANIIFAFLPTRPVGNSIAQPVNRKNRVGFTEHLRSVLCTLVSSRALLAAPVYLFLGVSTAFWITIYPTTLIFSKRLSEIPYLQAYYVIVFGVGEMAMGATISIVSKYVHNFAKMPSMIIGSILYFTALILSLLSTPSDATNTPSDAPTMLLAPSLELSLLIGFLLGLADNAFNTSRTVLCSMLIPDRISHVFAISKFHQVRIFAMSIFTFLSPMISMPLHFTANFIFGFLAIFSYYFAVR
ncbi:hypothetical protein PFISCL1PPCAC_12959, partial [Pristionchus fissidentatus]